MGTIHLDKFLPPAGCVLPRATAHGKRLASLSSLRTTVVILLCSGLLMSCGTARRTGRDVLAEASGTEFGAPGLLCSDTVAVASLHNVDYEQVINGCLSRDRESMHTFFWLSNHAGFDAASAQGHATVSGVLLRNLGDKFFGECLAKELSPIQGAVRDDLLYDLGYRDGHITLAEIKRKYPRTFPKEWADNKQVEAGR